MLGIIMYYIIFVYILHIRRDTFISYYNVLNTLRHCTNLDSELRNK